MSTLEAALEWASKGRPVFPCGRDKRPLTQNGFKNATTDPSAIRSMWAEHLDAMIGIATGSTSGLIVLDFDVDPAYLEKVECPFHSDLREAKRLVVTLENVLIEKILPIQV